MNPSDLTERLLRALSARSASDGLTVVQLARRLKVDPSRVKYALRMLNSDGKAHVDRWLPATTHTPAAVWVAGSGLNCPMPVQRAACPTCGRPHEELAHA